MPRQARTLQEYARRRNFAITPEPKGSYADNRTSHNGLLYVIQKHAASHLHYDFRLEWNGVLLSWAIPKGPSLRPSVKRLVVRTEDHPLAYGSFEGVIPEGQYGAGAVMVWDTGTWAPDQPVVDASLRKGQLKFELFGKKLRGAWVLLRAVMSEPSRKNQWLLIKRRDRYASSTDILAERPLSALSNRSLAEIAQETNGGIPRVAKKRAAVLPSG